MSNNIAAFHNYISEKYSIPKDQIDIIDQTGDVAHIMVRFMQKTDPELMMQIGAEIETFDFSVSPAAPQSFLEKVAAEGDAAAFVAAQQLAVLAGDSEKLKQKYAELALTAEQKAVLDAAATAAGIDVKPIKKLEGESDATAIR